MSLQAELDACRRYLISQMQDEKQWLLSTMQRVERDLRLYQSESMSPSISNLRRLQASTQCFICEDTLLRCLLRCVELQDRIADAMRA